MKLRKMNGEKLAVIWKKGVSKDYSRLKKINMSPTSLSREETTESKKVSPITRQQKKGTSTRGSATANCLPALHDSSDLLLQSSSSVDFQDSRPMPHLVKERDSKTSSALQSRNKRKLSKESLNAPSPKKSRAPKSGSEDVICDSDAPCLFAEPPLRKFEYEVVIKNRSKSVPRLPSYNLRSKHTNHSSAPNPVGHNLHSEANSTRLEPECPNLEKMSSDPEPNELKLNGSSEVKVVTCKYCNKPLSYSSETQCCFMCKAKLNRKKKDGLAKSPQKSKRKNAKLTSGESCKNVDAPSSSKPIPYSKGAGLKKKKKLVQSSKKRPVDPVTSIGINSNKEIISFNNSNVTTLGSSITITKCSNLPTNDPTKSKMNGLHDTCSNGANEYFSTMKKKAGRKSKKGATKQTSKELCPLKSNKPNKNFISPSVGTKNVSSDKNFKSAFGSAAATTKVCAPENNSPGLLPSISITLVDVKASEAPDVIQVKNTNIKLIRIENPKGSLSNMSENGKVSVDFRFQNCGNSKASSSAKDNCNSPTKESENSPEEAKEKQTDRVVNGVTSIKNLKRSPNKKKAANQSSSAPKSLENSNEVAFQSIENATVVSKGIVQNGDGTSNPDCPSELQRITRKRKFKVFQLPAAKVKKADIQLGKIVKKFLPSIDENSFSDSKEFESTSGSSDSYQSGLKGEKQNDCSATTNVKEKSSEFSTLQVGSSHNMGGLEDSLPSNSEKDPVISSKEEEIEKGSLVKAKSPTKSPKRKNKESKVNCILSSEFETQEGVSKLNVLQSIQSEDTCENNSFKTIDSNDKASLLNPSSTSPSDRATLKELLSSVPKNGIIVRKSASSDSEFLCIKCCQKLRSETECCWHYSKCNFLFAEGQSVSLKDISWICKLCRSHFDDKETLGNHECHIVDMSVSIPPHINRCNSSLVSIQSTLVVDTQTGEEGRCSQPDSNSESPIIEASTNVEHSSCQVEELEFSESSPEIEFGNYQLQSMFKPLISSVFTMPEDQKTDSEDEELDRKDDKKDLKALQLQFREVEFEADDCEETFNIFSEQPLAFDVVSRRIPRTCKRCQQPFHFNSNDLDRKLSVRILRKSKIAFKFRAICRNCDHKAATEFSLPVVSLADSLKEVFINYMSGQHRDADTTRYFFELIKCLCASRNEDVGYTDLDSPDTPPKEFYPSSLDPNTSWDSQGPSSREPMHPSSSSGPQISSPYSVAGGSDSASAENVRSPAQQSDLLSSDSLVESVLKNANIRYIRNFEIPDTYEMDSGHFCSKCFLSIPQDKISEHHYLKHDSSVIKTEVNVLKFSC